MGKIGASRLVRLSFFVGAVSFPLVLAGCKTSETAFDNNCKVGGATVGAVIGGIAGGLFFGKAGGKAGTALLGMAVGGLIGQQIGSMLDCQDKQALATASQTAGEAPVGQKIVWASNNAQVPLTAPPSTDPTPPPAAVAPSTISVSPPPPKPKAQAQEKTTSPSSNTTSVPQQSSQWTAVEPSKPVAEQWAAVEPIRSGGQSGNWGWVEPVSASVTSADGRTCRELKQVVVDASGQKREETVITCLNQQNQWVIASK